MIEFGSQAYSSTVFIVLTSIVMFGSFILSMITVSNAIRLRNVMLSWKAGKLGGYPLFSTIFLLLCITLGILSSFHRLSVDVFMIAAYVFTGINWFIASFLMSRRYITDHGIVKNINDPSQTVAWNSINDYLERSSEQYCHFTFFYSQFDEIKGRPRSVRLEIQVPHKLAVSFRKVLNYKLGRRFRQDLAQVSGFEHFNF